MPIKEATLSTGAKLTKFYYKVGEVAKLLGVSSSTVRNWQRQANIEPERRGAKGDRFFTQEQICLLDNVRNMVDERGLRVNAALKKLDEEFPQTVNNVQEAIGMLKNIRNQLNELLENA